MTQREQEILKLIESDPMIQQSEIAEILGKTDKSIDNALQRIKTKIRKISLPDRA